MHLELWQWSAGVVAAMLVGISKTATPGAGILVVPLLAGVFGGRLSVGIMLPMLIFADCFAVAWYRRHAQWHRLAGLLPWVLVGVAVGAALLWVFGRLGGDRDVLGKVIGWLVLSMLALNLLQHKLGDRIAPKSRVGIAVSGSAVGVSTTISNAAGPVMAIYLSALRMPKEQLMGTVAWFFFVLNLTKLPILIALTAVNPEKPLITILSLKFIGTIWPVILLGVFLGKWMLPRISQRLFNTLILTLAGISAVKLVL
ncbi:MAG: sulfite exporter TauE/SafE family protein [Armatimonadetes bacterium]|nr:sulfite exporter TauE/SafE family protein [Armatimonadota bacterium]